MVAAVDRKRVAAQQLVQRGAGNDAHLVGSAVVRRLHTVADIRRALLRKVLPKRAAVSDVHDLNAAADAEHRQVALHGAAQHARVHAVAQSARLPLGGERFGAIARGRHILAAGQDDAIAEVKKAVNLLRGVGQRQHHRHGAGLFQPFHIPRQHPIARFPRVVKRR